jgi:hypothetical protein
MFTVRGNRAAASRTHVICLALIVVGLLAGCEAQTAPTSTPSAVATPSPTVNTPQPDPTGGPAAEMSIASVDVDGVHLTVAGFVAEISEDGGVCTFDLASKISGATTTATTTGAANGTNTTCGSAQVPLASLSRGTWTVALNYVSPTHTLTSGPLEVEIP